MTLQDLPEVSLRILHLERLKRLPRDHRKLWTGFFKFLHSNASLNLSKSIYTVPTLNHGYEPRRIKTSFCLPQLRWNFYNTRMIISISALFKQFSDNYCQKTDFSIINPFVQSLSCANLINCCFFPMLNSLALTYINKQIVLLKEYTDFSMWKIHMTI